MSMITLFLVFIGHLFDALDFLSNTKKIISKIRSLPKKAISIFFSQKNYSFEEVIAGVNKIIKHLSDTEFKPDIIIAIGTAGMIISGIMKAQGLYEIPIIVIKRERYSQRWPDKFSSDHKIFVGQQRRTLYLPADLKNLNNSKVIIVDGCFATGIETSIVLEHMSKIGFNMNDDVRHVALINILTNVDEFSKLSFFAYESKAWKNTLPWDSESTSDRTRHI